MHSIEPSQCENWSFKVFRIISEFGIFRQIIIHVAFLVFGLSKDNFPCQLEMEGMLQDFRFSFFKCQDLLLCRTHSVGV